MKVRIEFDCDNAAFAHGAVGEMTRILASAANKLGMMYAERHRYDDNTESLMDHNGNKVGFVALESDDE